METRSWKTPRHWLRKRPNTPPSLGAMYSNVRWSTYSPNGTTISTEYSRQTKTSATLSYSGATSRPNSALVPPGWRKWNRASKITNLRIPWRRNWIKWRNLNARGKRFYLINLRLTDSRTMLRTWCTRVPTLDWVPRCHSWPIDIEGYFHWLRSVWTDSKGSCQLQILLQLKRNINFTKIWTEEWHNVWKNKRWRN